MDVSCPRCHTLYELDPRQVRRGGATLKCSQCSHLFRIEVPQQGLFDESQRRWMVRKQGSGDILYFDRFDTLHRWMMERNVGPKDAISRTGERWTLLEDIGEFTPIFQVLASIESLTQPGGGEVPRRPSMRGPRRASATTVPGRPGGPQEAGADLASLSKQARREEPTPLVISQGGSGEAVEVEGAPQRISEERWTFGDLEVADKEVVARAAGSGRRRKWPLALVLSLLIVGGVGGFIILGDEGELGALKERLRSLRVEPEHHQVEDVQSPWEQAEVGARAALMEARAEVDRASAPLINEAVERAQDISQSALEVSEERARRAVRPSVPSLIAAGRRALERGEGESARGRFQAALDQEPRNAEALIGLGWAYLAIGDQEPALSRFNAALVQAPQTGEALIGMGRAERERGNPQAALAAYEDYLQRFPAGPHASIAKFQSEQLRSSLQRQ